MSKIDFTLLKSQLSDAASLMPSIAGKKNPDGLLA